MKSRINTISFSVLLLSFVFSFSSCKKEKSDSDTSSALDNFIAENESYKLEDFANSAAKDSGVHRLEEEAYTVLPNGVIVFIDLVGVKKMIRIVFDPGLNGGKGILCDDGKFRKGIIEVTWDKNKGYDDSLRTATIKTINYFVNYDQFAYTKTVTYNGRKSGHPSWDVNVTQADITFADGKTIHWTSHRTTELIYEGPIFYLNVYSITGNAEATGRDGKHFTANIIKPLKVAVACRWIEEGTIDLTPDGKPTRTIDYGNGSCDNQATVEIKGVVYNINL